MFLSRGAGANFSVKPDSHAKHTASSSFPVFTNSSIISARDHIKLKVKFIKSASVEPIREHIKN